MAPTGVEIGPKGLQISGNNNNRMYWKHYWGSWSVRSGDFCTTWIRNFFRRIRIWPSSYIPISPIKIIDGYYWNIGWLWLLKMKCTDLLRNNMNFFQNCRILKILFPFFFLTFNDNSVNITVTDATLYLTVKSYPRYVIWRFN